MQVSGYVIIDPSSSIFILVDKERQSVDISGLVGW